MFSANNCMHRSMLFISRLYRRGNRLSRKRGKWALSLSFLPSSFNVLLHSPCPPVPHPSFPSWKGTLLSALISRIQNRILSQLAFIKKILLFCPLLPLKRSVNLPSYCETSGQVGVGPDNNSAVMIDKGVFRFWSIRRLTIQKSYFIILLSKKLIVIY